MCACSEMQCRCRVSGLFFFNDTATAEIYTLSLHDALPISAAGVVGHVLRDRVGLRALHDVLGHDAGALLDRLLDASGVRDRKSTRLNSSHANISYAVFCLKKKTTFSNLNMVPCYSTHSFFS